MSYRPSWVWICKLFAQAAVKITCHQVGDEALPGHLCFKYTSHRSQTETFKGLHLILLLPSSPEM